MKKFLATIIFLIYACIVSAQDTTAIIGTWKIHYYRIYNGFKTNKHTDTSIYTVGYITFYKDHTYKTSELNQCFMEGNDFICPPIQTGIWKFTSKNVLLIKADEKKVNQVNGKDAIIMPKHGVYLKKINQDEMHLRTEYYEDRHRKYRFVIDGYLVRKPTL
jgi:hypothetical protein